MASDNPIPERVDLIGELRQCATELGEAAKIIAGRGLPRVATLYEEAAARATRAADAGRAAVMMIPKMTERQMLELRTLTTPGSVTLKPPSGGDPFDRFLAAYRILKTIDLADLQTVGVFAEATHAGLRDEALRDRANAAWSAWEAFRDDPLNFLMRCDEALARQIWSEVEAGLRDQESQKEA